MKARPPSRAAWLSPRSRRNCPSSRRSGTALTRTSDEGIDRLRKRLAKLVSMMESDQDSDLDLLADFDRVLGLSLDAPVAADAPLPDGAAALLERRAAARAAKDFAASDALRDELAALGVDVRDTPAGQETTVRR